MNVSRKITKIMVEEHVVQGDEFELYEYSVNAVLEMGSNILISLLLGALLDMFIETILFLAIVIPLRSCIGGWHAKKTMNCFIISVITYLVCIILPCGMKGVHMILCTAIFYVENIHICIVAPVDCLEKPLTEFQKRKMTFITHIILATLSLVYMELLFWGLYKLCQEILLILLYANLSLLAEKIRKMK